MNAPTDVVQTMIAEWQIRDLIGRYARGVDRRDGKQIGECFHPGALTHYGDFDGTVEAFVPWVLDFLQIYTRTMHFMGTTVIDWPDSGDSNFAVAETYATVLHEKTTDTPGRSWAGWIRYIDRFERRIPSPGSQSIWRIADRTVVGDLLRIDPAENHRHFADVMLTGRPVSDDPLYACLALLYDPDRTGSDKNTGSDIEC